MSALVVHSIKLCVRGEGTWEFFWAEDSRNVVVLCEKPYVSDWCKIWNFSKAGGRNFYKAKRLTGAYVERSRKLSSDLFSYKPAIIEAVSKLKREES